METLLKFDIEVFTIMKANLTDEQLNCSSFFGYVTYLLPKFRQVASGILVGVKRGFIADFEVFKTKGEI